MSGFSVLPVTGIPELREGDDLAAMIVERTTVGGALNRSANLTRERRWHVLGVVAGCVLIAVVPLAVIEYLLDEIVGVASGSTGDLILSYRSIV